MSSRSSFTLPQRLLHWLMAICIVAMLFIGVGMVSTVSPTHLALLGVHKPLGIAILVLVVLRLIVRLTSGAPALPADLPAVMKLGAHLSHVALYGLMFAMPLLGWAMESAGSYPVMLCPGFELPPIVAPNPQLYTVLHTAHVGLAYCFFLLVLAHLAAALFHGLVRRDGVFSAMVRSGR
jgi:cytochrome b561